MVINNSTWYFDNNSHFEVNNTVGDLHYIHIPWSELCSNWIIKWTIGTISASLHWKRIFSLIFGWEHYLKDCTMQEPFFNLFLFFFFWERFFPSLKGRNIRKLHCGKIFFKICFFFFYWMSFYRHFWVYILSKRHHYARILFILSLLLLLGEVFLSFLGGHFFTRL